MTIEANAAPDVAADTATSEEIANTQPEVASPESGTEVEQNQSEQQESKDPADKTVQRLERRIGRVTAARYQAEARAQQLEEQLARYQQQTQPDVDQQQAYSAQDIERIATEKAEQITRARELTQKVDQVLKQGQSIAGFDDLCNSVHEEVPFYERNGSPTPFLRAVLRSEKPHELIAYIGQNPDVAESLNGLDREELGYRIARIEAGMHTAKVSKSPAPLQPVTPKGAPVTKSETSMTDAEWYAARRKRS